MKMFEIICKRDPKPSNIRNRYNTLNMQINHKETQTKSSTEGPALPDITHNQVLTLLDTVLCLPV